MKLEKREIESDESTVLSEDLVSSLHLHGSSQPSVYNSSANRSDALSGL